MSAEPWSSACSDHCWFATRTAPSSSAQRSNGRCSPTLLLESSRDVVPAERLIDELWGEDPPATAIKALQVHVSQLRRALGPAQPIITRPTGYAIQIDA